jgi:membrane-bound lytic murein transglycosylase D
MKVISLLIGVACLLIFPIYGDADADSKPAVIEESEEVDSEVVATDLQLQVQESRPWESPNYGGQKSALGYDDQAFVTPLGLEDRVHFWTRIYTEFTTDQGVIHDQKYPHVIYEALDFRSIYKSASPSEGEKAKWRKSFLKEKKKWVFATLQKLSKLNDAQLKGLEGDELRVWKALELIPKEDRFANMNPKKRIRFQLGQSDKFKAGIFFSGRYLKEMERIFREAGVPVELTRLPFVESSFNLFARSKVGASGIWQFMRSTGKLYRLKATAFVDDRNDPIRATEAAAKKMKENYKLLGTWPLAVTAYNHGPAGVRRIVTKLETTDLAEIINTTKARRFGFASENFYACFLAAVNVEREAAKFFPGVAWGKELKYVERTTTAGMNFRQLLPLFQNSLELASLFNPQVNPALRKGSKPLPLGTRLRIPAASEAKWQALLDTRQSSLQPVGKSKKSGG